MTGRVMRQSRTGLIWLTNQTEDEGRLNELLLDKSVTGGEVLPLAAAEAVLIVARMTRQPADWAFSARIWTEGVRRPINRPWAMLARQSTSMAYRPSPSTASQLPTRSHARWS